MGTKLELEKFFAERKKALWASFRKKAEVFDSERIAVDEARKALAIAEEAYRVARGPLEKEFKASAQAQYFADLDMRQVERCPKCEGEIELKETGDPVGLCCKAACGWAMWHPLV